MHLRRATRLAVLAVATAAAVALVPAGPAAADEAPLSATDQLARDRLTIRSLAKRLGPDLAGMVVDAQTGQVVWSKTPGERQMPASTVKIITAVTALEAFGPAHTFTTQATTGTGPRRVVLVGSGDPSLSTGDLRRLARQVVAWAVPQGLTRIRVDVDDTLFPAPTNAYGWRPDYVIRDVSPVRALVVDQRRSWDTSLDAGRAFARVLERKGLDVLRVTRRARPADAQVIGEVTGDDLATQVGYMLRTSDNDVAEGLHRLVALQTGFAPTWEGAAQAQVASLARLGVSLRPGSVYDGSGLSRRDRLRPQEVVAVLRTMFDPAHPNLAVLQRGAFAVAGVTGTLGPSYLRYTTRPTKCATGLVEAKTGSLTGAIALSGLARAADGRIKVFSFLLNKVPATLATRRAVDKLATTVTGCW